MRDSEARIGNNPMPDAGCCSHADAAVTVLVAVAALALAAWRLTLGVDLTDEAFNVALAYRFIAGDRPFVEEMNITQSAALLMVPPLRVFLALTDGRTEGLILFSRALFFGFQLAVAGVTLHFGRRLTGCWTRAMPAALLVAFFVHYNIPSLGYNALSAGLLTAGTLLAALTRRRRMALVAGLLQGLADFAYPPLVVPTVVGIALLFRRDRHLAWSFVAGIAMIGTAAALWIVLDPGIAHLLAVLEHMKAMGYGTSTPRRLSVLVKSLTSCGLHMPHLWMICLAAVGAASRWPRRAAWLLLLLGAGVVFPFGFEGSARGGGVVFYLGLLAPLVVLAAARITCPESDRVLTAERHVLLSSAVAAAVTSYASSNGYISASLGLLPAAALSVVVIARVARQVDLNGRLASGLLLLPAMAALVWQLSVFYREAPLGQLVRRVQSGPFALLATTQAQAESIEMLQRDLARCVSPSERVLVYSHLPGAYLMGRFRPATDTLWLVTARTFAYFERWGRGPDAVLRMRTAWLESPPGIMDDYLQRERFAAVLERRDYALFRRAGTCRP